jgi:hypothetical protein
MKKGTPFTTYYFVRIAEGLRNAGCTFVKMTSAIFKDQFGKNISIYSLRPIKSTILIFEKIPQKSAIVEIENYYCLI